MTRHGKDSGSALIIVVVLIVVLSGIASAFMLVSTGSANLVGETIEDQQAFYLAESGVSDAINQLNTSVTPVATQGKSSSGAGTYDVSFIYWNGDGRDNDGDGVVDGTDPEEQDVVTLTSTAGVGKNKRALEVIVSRAGGGIFWNAVYAGNSSGDPFYKMNFGGTGASADAVNGSIYSGQDIAVTGAAAINDEKGLAAGSLAAAGTVTGAAPEDIVLKQKQTPPKVGDMLAKVPPGELVDVAGEFKSATYKLDDAGGSAWQLPATSAAHILRRDPSDRVAQTGATAKQDFFLEDPYETVSAGSQTTSTGAFKVSIDPAANKKVYVVDGNLWINNKKSYSLMFTSAAAEGVQITFVVKGNVYISDNVFLQDKNRDAVSFMAMKDPAVADSGNIYIGDPGFGTTYEMNAFLYAENNFVDNNLDSTGSKFFKINGNMTAGNQVAIKRDYKNSSGQTLHSKMQVNLDPRIRDGKVQLPGIENLYAQGASAAAFSRVTWREVTPK